MTEFWIGVPLAAVAAVLAFLVPRLWHRGQRLWRGGPLITSLQSEGLAMAGPEILLVPDEARPGPSTPSPLEHRDVLEWQRSVGGVHLGGQSVRLTLRGLGPRPVLVTKVEVVVLRRDPPLTGWYVAPEMGGGIEVRLFVSDLDGSDPVALLLSNDKLLRDYAFRVTEDDVEVFQVEVFTTRHFITWGIDIEYEDGGRLGRLEVRDSRLQVTAASDGNKAFSDGPDAQWVEVPWGRDFGQKHADLWRTMSVGTVADGDMGGPPTR